MTFSFSAKLLLSTNSMLKLCYPEMMWTGSWWFPNNTLVNIAQEEDFYMLQPALNGDLGAAHWRSPLSFTSKDFEIAIDYGDKGTTAARVQATLHTSCRDAF